MRKLLLVLVFLCGLQVKAQNYLITFAGTGASTSVSTVKVENLTTGTILTMNGSDILHLTIATGVNPVKDYKSSELKIYPNPMTDNSTLEILPPVAGNAVIAVIDMTGKQVAQIQSRLEKQKQAFKLSGLKNGFYLVDVKGNNYQLSGKIFCNSVSKGTISIEKDNNIIQTVEQKVEKADSKGAQSTVDMAYTSGERIKFTGTSGIYSTVKTDIPASDKTITFNFIACTDGDNNNYSIIEIGPQVWMAENLKTTKYSDNSNIPPVTVPNDWTVLSTPGYCWYNNDAPTYKAVYGALYNWYAVDVVSNGGKNVCPTDWHVPTDDQWTTFENNLIGYGYNYDGTTTGNLFTNNKMAKALASATGWNSDTGVGTIGNTDYPDKRDATGFAALPGGYRYIDGTYYYIGAAGDWWSATEYADVSQAWYRGMGWSSSNVYRASFNKRYGISVRCVKD